jgi:DNA-directed RNA polymerase specialized sigma24 family protein
VTCRKIHDFRDSRAHRERGSGDSATYRLLDERPGPDNEPDRWEHDYQRHLLGLAAEQVRDSFAATTWQAFWLIAVEGHSGEEAAQALGLSVGAAYVAKSRVLARLKDQIQQLEGT